MRSSESSAAEENELSAEPDRYLDAAATAPLAAAARTAMLHALDAGPGNPSSVHSAGHRSAVLLSEARHVIAQAFRANQDEVVFTSGGTEANNLAVIGLALAQPRGRHIVTSMLEHPSVLESCRFLERVFGFEIDHVEVDSRGMIDPVKIASLLRSDTTLVTIGLANGEIGSVQAVGEITNLAHRIGALMHTDAVQAAASLPVSFSADGWPGPVDAMSLASHKFGGPQGAGALLLRGGVAVEPLLHGGGQEQGRRSGTENIPAIAGFAAAVAAAAGLIGTRALGLSSSRDTLIARMLREVPGSSLTGHPTERLPGHASFVFEGVSGESLLVALDAVGIAASSGSACAAGKDEPSPALLAIGVSEEVAGTALRFTLPAPLRHELIDRVVATVGSEVRTARSKQRHL